MGGGVEEACSRLKAVVVPETVVAAAVAVVVMYELK